MSSAPSFRFVIYLLCLSYSVLGKAQIIMLDSLQIYNFSSNSTQTFKVPSSSSFVNGNFYVSISPLSSQAIFHMIKNPRICNDDAEPREFSLEFVYYFEGETRISFNGNTLHSHCFDLDIFLDLKEAVIIDYIISVIFTPTKNVVDLDTSYEFDLDQGVEKEFSYNLKNNLVQLLQIIITSTNRLSLNDSSNSIIELRNHEKVCIQSQSPTLLSWICDLSLNLNENFDFSLINLSGNSKNYNISIYKIEPPRINPGTRIISNSFIPGFGSIYVMPLRLFGTLEIKAQQKNEKYLPIVSADSISTLFEALGQYSNGMDIPTSENTIISKGPLVIQNEHVSTERFFFIEDIDSKPFSLESKLIQQMIVDVEAESMFYIDPEKNSFQYIKLKMVNYNIGDNFEIIVEALQPNSFMNISFSRMDPLGDTYSKEDSQEKSDHDELRLSFLVGEYNVSSYVTIHTTKKGYYLFKVAQTKSVSTREVVTVVVSITLMLLWIYCFVTIIALFKGKQKVSQEILQIPRNSQIPEIDLESNIPSQIEARIILDNNSSTYCPNQSQNANSVRKSNALKLFDHLKEQGLSDSRGTKCDICYEAKETVVFRPCDHACACAFCALIIVQTSLKCPLCRREIEDVLLNKTEESSQR